MAAGKEASQPVMGAKLPDTENGGTATPVDNAASLFEYPALSQRIEFLKRLSTRSSAPTFVLGEWGSGKSTLLNYMHTHIRNSGGTSIVIKPFDGIKHKKLLGLLADELTRHGTAVCQRSSQQVRRTLAHMAGTSAGLCLLFDDSDVLPTSVFEFLFRCQQKIQQQGHSLRLFFFSRPVIKQRLEQIESRTIKQAQIQFLYMPRLNKQGLSGYLEYRADTHALPTATRHSDELVDSLYKKSSGLPGLVNEHLASLLENNSNRASQSAFACLARRLPQRRISVTVGLGMIIAAAMVYTAMESRSTAPRTSSHEAISVAAIEPQRPSPGRRDFSKEPTTVTRLSKAPPAPISPPAAAPPGGTTTTPAQGTTRNPTPPVEHNSPLQTDWVQSQNPAHFTIQLLATGNKYSLLQATAHYSQLQPLAYVHTTHQDKDWFVLVYGTYASYSKAKTALAELTPEMQRANPWIRKFASLHPAIGQ